MQTFQGNPGDSQLQALTHCFVCDSEMCAVPYCSLMKAMVQHVKEAGLPCYLSFTAGTYVCNSIMYNVLYMCEKRYPGIRAGFIHVPYACGQVIDKANTTPSMPLETIAKSLEYAIEAVAIDRADGGESAGELH